MRVSFAPPRNILLVDHDAGTVLNAPPETTVSDRYVDTHPFIARNSTHVFAGPDANQAASGAVAEDVIRYEIIGNDTGSVYIRRVD